MKVENLWIEAEQWAPGEWNPADCNSDVKVTLSDDSEWMATFFTYTNIKVLKEKNQATGECLSDRYFFWATDLILVDLLTRARILEVVEDLIETNEFERAFERTVSDDADESENQEEPSEESERATKLLEGKRVKRLVRFGPTEVMLEFRDGTRLYVDGKGSRFGTLCLLIGVRHSAV